MHYSPYQIKRHIDILNERAKVNKPSDPECLKLFAVVKSKKEAIV
jgi:hypothetical protein